MIQPDGHHLAEFNFGVLAHDWDDPRIADFSDNLDRVNRVAERSDGFVWRMSEADMDAAQNEPGGVLGANHRVASTLSVWRDAQSLLTFVFNTVHRQFYDRSTEWFTPGISSNLVLWWVPTGTRPSVEDAVARFDHWNSFGDSDFAFGWKHLPEASSFGLAKPEQEAAKP